LSKPGRVKVTGEHGSDQLIEKDSESRITTTIKTFDIADEIIPIVERGFMDHVQDHYDVRFEFPDILRYDPGGHYAVHNDSEVWDKSAGAWRLGEDRQYSLLIYLNDEFSGGSVHFPELDFTVHPKPGLLLAFPSDHRYAHTALPVESAIRYVIVSWGAIVDARRLHDGATLGVVYAAPEFVPARLLVMG
jgi:predicted 2-oxoglutarate/Fe(II)-dependent dioxygenase YbiX